MTKRITLSEHFNISNQELKNLKILNPVLTKDVNLFIDPSLLKNSEYSIFNTNGASKFNNFFKEVIEDIYLMMNLAGKAKVIARKNIIKKLQSKEIKGLCLGYSISNNKGRGLGPKMADQIVSSAEIILANYTGNDNIFRLIFLLDENIGGDTISDLTSHILHEEIATFTEELSKELNIETHEFEVLGKRYKLPLHPYEEGSYILLVPRDILSRLPVDNDFDYFTQSFSSFMTYGNDEIRMRVNDTIAEILRQAELHKKKDKEIKSDLKETIYSDADAVSVLLDKIKENPAKAYDADDDPLSINADANARELFETLNVQTIKIAETNAKTIDNIIEEYKNFIERNNVVKKSLYKDLSKRKTYEKEWQANFHTYIDKTLRDSNIDITPECETGFGPVDFKFSNGETFKVLLEMKLSSNSQYMHGLTKQLELYKESTTNVSKSYYMFINLESNSKKYQDKPNKLFNKRDQYDLDSEVVIINGVIYDSASNI